MIKRYVSDGIEYDVAEHRLDEFLKDHPNATLVEAEEESVIQEDIIETPQETTEIVEEKPVELPEVETPEIKDVKVKEEKPEEDKLGNWWEESIFTPSGIKDYFNDLIRAGKEGWSQADLVDPSFDLYKNGSETTDKEIVNWIDTQESIANKNMGSAEMKEVLRISEEAGGGMWGFIKGAWHNPSTLSTMLVSSIATQLGSLRKSDEVRLAGIAGAATGATAGSLATPIGTGFGAITGLMGGSMGAMETGLTFAELLQEEIKGDLTKEKVRAILENPEKLADLKNKSLGRGVTIAAIELATMGLAKGVGGKLASAGFKKVPTSLQGPMMAGAATGAIEIVGGGTGEVAGRFVAGQEMDAIEIGFEAFAGLGSAPITMGSQVVNLNKNIDNMKITNVLKDTKYKNVSEAFRGASLRQNTTSEIEIVKIKNSRTILDQQVDARIASGEISPSVGERMKINFRETQSGYNQVKNLGFNLDQETQAINLIKQKSKLNKKIDGQEPSLTGPEQEQIKQIDLQLQGIVKERVKSGAAGVRAMADQANISGITINTFKDEAAIIKHIEDNKIKTKNVKKSAGGQGFIVTGVDVNGNVTEEIIINEKVASREQAVNVAAHEFLHAVLRKTVTEKGTGKKLGDSLNEYLNKIDSDQIKDSEFKQRLEQYKKRPADERGEEVLTLFSDAINTGDLVFEENIFTKMGDTIRTALQSIGVKVKFNNGRDVYNFIKDYNKSVEKGKLTSAQTQVAKEGATGKLVTEGNTVTKEGTTKESQAKPKRSNESIANENAKINQEILDAGVKNADGEIIADENAREKLIDNNLGKVRQLAQKAATNPAIANLEPGKRKTYDDFFGEYYLELDALTKTYRPENTKGDFGAYMMKNLERRYGSVLGKLKKGEIDQTTSIDSETARQVVDTSDTTGDVDAKTTPKIEKVSKKVLSKQLEFDKVDKAIAKLLKDPNFKIPTTYKSSAQITPKLIAELFGVNPEQYVDAKKSLTKADVIAARTFIAKNPSELYAALPAPATEQGKSTGISPKLLTAIYGAAEGRVDSKLGKSTQGLKAREKMEKPPFNQKAFIKIFTPDKIMKVENQTAESGMIKALMKEIEKAMVNQAIRLNPDSKLTQQAEQKYKEGLSRTLASESTSTKLFEVIASEKSITT